MGAPATGDLASRALTAALAGGPASIDQTDRPSCIASLEIPEIGTLSVLCLDLLALRRLALALDGVPRG